MAAHGLTVFATIPSSSTPNQSSRKSHEQVLGFGLTNSFLGTKIPRFSATAINPSRYYHVAPNRRSSSTIVATISFPTSNKEAVAADKMPKWSSRAIRTFNFAELEARKLRHPNTGSESLLLGILVEGTSLTSKFLREHGITHFKARDEVLTLLGKGDKYLRYPYPNFQHPPLTELAKRSLDQAVEIKLKSGEGGELTCAHLLLGIWSVEQSAGHKILAILGFDDEKAKEVAKTMDRDVDLNFKRSLLGSTDLKVV